MKLFLNKYKYILIALAVLLVYLSPNIFFPEKARFLVHDNLNSNVVWYKNLAESGKMFASSKEIIPNSVGGLPRGCYPSEFNVLHLLYLLFSPLTAYNINMVLMHLIAFFGMYLFSRKYIFGDGKDRAAVMVSLVFALLPFWPSGGAAITAQPLLLYALFNIYNRDLSWKNWLIIVLIPMYSVLVLTNLFLIPLVFAGFVLISIYRKKFNMYFVLALIIFTIASVVAEYRLFYMQFVEHFKSHRDVVSASGSINLKGVIGISITHFLKGHYHFITGQSPLIILSALLGLVFAKTRRQRLIIIAMLGLIGFISFVFVLPGWKPVAELMASSPILGVLNLRFYSLFPLLWFIVFTYTLNVMLDAQKRWLSWGVGAICGVASVLLFFSVNVKDYQNNNYAENSFYNTFVSASDPGFATFDQFYRTDLFKKVNETLPPGDYYIASLGFQPEVMQFNGYNTIDGYYYYYPAAYNKIMSEINAEEIKKLGNRQLKSHCILLSADLESNKKIIDDLDLDFDKMKSINAKYIFSSKKIINERLVDEQHVKSLKDGIFIYRLE